MYHVMYYVPVVNDVIVSSNTVRSNWVNRFLLICLTQVDKLKDIKNRDSTEVNKNAFQFPSLVSSRPRYQAGFQLIKRCPFFFVHGMGCLMAGIILLMRRHS